MGKMGSIRHFPRALSASIWGHCSQVPVFKTIWGAHTHKKGCDNDTFRAVFSQNLVFWDRQTLPNKKKCKMTDRPSFTPPPTGSAFCRAHRAQETPVACSRRVFKFGILFETPSESPKGPAIKRILRHSNVLSP